MRSVRLPSLSALRAFEAAARHASFTKAAQELNITQGAVSYQVRMLEEHLGVALFRREKRKVVLTEKAEHFVPILQRAFADMAEGIAAFSTETATSRLTVALSTYFAINWLSRRLGDFSQRHPHYQLRLQHPETTVRLGVDEVDMLICWQREGWTPASDFDAEMLFAVAVSPVCNPALCAKSTQLTSPEELRNHVLLRDEVTRQAWSEWLKLARVDDSYAACEMAINDPEVYIQAAIDGQGVAMADELIADDIDLGRLIRPFDLELHGYGYFIVHHKDALHRPPVRAFRDWIITQAKSFRPSC